MVQLSWTNNLLILSGAKNKEESHFYLKLGKFKAEYLRKMNLHLESLDRGVKKSKRIQGLELYYVVPKMKMLLNIQLVKTCLRL